ncbi:MAG: polysaccharide biosynthesis/export family protein [Candidatus Omnitrophica bacterium]|nr:polysaccharide biosynthesis/export family protein [Candidatus Omnitrophota bacterium]
MKKVFFTLIIILFGAIITYGQPQNSIIKDVRGDIYDHSAQIVIEANTDIDYIDYTLSDPPRLIIDPVGKIYSDLKEVITFENGPVKKVNIIKGRPEEGTGNFYPIDFISIELAEPLDYKVDKSIKEELIVDITGKQEAAPEEPSAEVAPPAVEETIPPEEVTALPDIKIQKTEEPPAEELQKVIPLEQSSYPQAEPAGFIYKIGEGDNLDISVWQHEDLARKVVVRPDGFISFPLVGDIKAVGLTPPQLASNLKEGLSKLVRDPQVTVIVSGFGSKNIFVLGEVTKPGAYQFRGGISILDAISEAGGWKNSAVLNSVMLVRRVFAEQPEAYRLNVYAIIKNGDFSQNMALEPGDVIYVPKSFVANIGGFIENLKVNVGAYITETTTVLN